MLMAILMAATVPAAAVGPARLAVLEFENELRGVDRVYFSDLVRGEIKKAAPALTVMTRENVVELLTASGKDLAGCEGSCEVQTGRLLGADYVVSGRLTRIGRRSKLTLRIHDTRTAALLGTAAAEGDSIEDLDSGVSRAAAEIAGLAHAAPPPPQPLLPPWRAGPVTWIGLGAGAVALGGGTFFGLRSRSILGSDRVTQLGGSQVHSISEADADKANGYSGKANVLFIAGAVLVATGLLAGFWGTR